MQKDKIIELLELAAFLEGMAANIQGMVDRDRILLAASKLNELSKHICCHGVFGCPAGHSCTSSHK